MCSHCEREPNSHSTRVLLHRSFEKVPDFGEANDIIEFAIDFRPGHTEDGAVKIDIFAPGQLTMETRTNFKQAGHSTADLNTAFRRLGDAAQYFEQRAFARSVAANDPADLTFTDIEANIL